LDIITAMSALACAAASKKMQDEMLKLQAATKTGNLDQIKAAFGPVGQACKACHDNFKLD
jgi:cytochrome c556